MKTIFLRFYILLLCFCFSTSYISSQTFDNALLEYWPFTTFSSASGSISGQPTGNAKISSNAGESFLSLGDGNSRVILDKGLDLFNNFTFCFWYQPDDSKSNGVIFHQKKIGGKRFFKLRFDSNVLIFECCDEFGYMNYVSTKNLSLIAGKRYFFSIVIQNENFSVSIDEQVVATSKSVKLNIRESQSADLCSFGALEKDELSVKGRLYDFLFFNRMLNTDELNQIFSGYWKSQNLQIAKIENKPEIPVIKQRTSVLSKTITDIVSDSVLIEYYDRDQVDGDTISIYLNGVLVVEKQRVDKSKKTIRLPLQKDKDNFVTLFAENLGKVPPNTATVRIFADGKKYELNINSDFVQNGTILLRTKGP
jgi:hypothetical protein